MRTWMYVPIGMLALSALILAASSIASRVASAQQKTRSLVGFEVDGSSLTVVTESGEVYTTSLEDLIKGLEPLYLGEIWGERKRPTPTMEPRVLPSCVDRAVLKKETPIYYSDEFVFALDDGIFATLQFVATMEGRKDPERYGLTATFIADDWVYLRTTPGGRLLVNTEVKYPPFEGSVSRSLRNDLATETFVSLKVNSKHMKRMVRESSVAVQFLSDADTLTLQLTDEMQESIGCFLSEVSGEL